ncbi:MAG: hypothetical protein ACTSPX_06290 [Candidatus Thorarchaeota archaeon]
MTETPPTTGTIRASRRVSLIALMAALALVGNDALVVVPNVELGSTVFFVTAYMFGFSVALPCVFIVSLAFGLVNPWGAFIPQIWITQVIGWSYMTVVAELLRPKSVRGKYPRNIELAFVGGIMTVFFDLVTNIGYSLAFSIPYYVALIAGLPFMVVHVLSNAFLFGTAVPLIQRTVSSNLADQIWE